MNREKITICAMDKEIQVDCFINGKYVDMTDRKSALNVAGQLTRVSILICKQFNGIKDNDRQYNNNLQQS